MKYEDKISMLTTIASANGMMYALACMEGATITKRLSLALDNQLDRMAEAQEALFKEATEEEVIPDDGQKKKIGFSEIQIDGHSIEEILPHQ